MWDWLQFNIKSIYQESTYDGCALSERHKILEDLSIRQSTCWKLIKTSFPSNVYFRYKEKIVTLNRSLKRFFKKYVSSFLE